MQGQNKIERAATLDPELKHSVSCFLFNAVVQFLGTNTPTHLVTFMSTWRSNFGRLVADFFSDI